MCRSPANRLIAAPPPARAPAEVSSRPDFMRRTGMLRTTIGLSLLVLSLGVSTHTQEGFSLFTSDFPAEEFATRRAAIYKAIGSNGMARLQAAPSPSADSRFRQTNEFSYVPGIEMPHAYLLLDASTSRATLYLPHRNERREASEGKLLS